MKTAIALVHSRYSTNTTLLSWNVPIRIVTSILLMAEINTLKWAT